MADVKGVMLLAALLLAGTGCSKGALSVSPDPLGSIKRELDLEVLWTNPVASLLGGAFALEFDSQAPCAIGSDNSIKVYAGDDGSTKSASPLASTPASDAACSGDLRAYVDVSNRLVVLDSDGGELWKTPLHGTAAGAPIFVPGGSALVMQDGSGRIVSYNARNGDEVWNFNIPGAALRIEGDAGLVIAGDLLLVGTLGGKVYAINYETGLDEWEVVIAVPEGAHEISRIVHVNPPAWGDSVACASSYQGNLVCTNLENGRLIWSKRFSSTKRPAVGSGIVAALDDRDVLQAFSLSNGEVAWTNDTMKNRGLRLLGMSGDVLLVGDFEGYVHALDGATGAVLGRERIAAGPLVAGGVRGDGTFIVRSADGVLARVRLTTV